MGFAPAPDDEEIRRLRGEVPAMRQVIEGEMQRFTDARLRGNAVRATALDLMDEYGFDAGISRDVVLQIPLETEAHRGGGLMLGLISRSSLAVGPGATCEEDGALIVNVRQMTSVDGLYAIGDVVSALNQISVATGHAAIAATDVHNRLGANFA